MSVEKELIGKIQAVLKAKYGGVGPDAQRQMFDAYDENNDGLIDSDELAKILSDAGVGNALTRGFWVKGVIARMDENKDQHISFDEFRTVLSASKQGG